MLKRLYDLILKFISVKGTMVILSFVLVMGYSLPPVYAFYSLCLMVGAREIQKVIEALKDKK